MHHQPQISQADILIFNDSERESIADDDIQQILPISNVAYDIVSI